MQRLKKNPQLLRTYHSIIEGQIKLGVLSLLILVGSVS